MLLSQLKLNEANPRFIKDDKFKKLIASIKDFPKMMELRPIVYDPVGNVILGGNMRYRALVELGYKEIPDAWTKPADQLTDDEKQRFIIEDNVGFGEWDWDMLANEWDEEELKGWGMDIPVNFNTGEVHEDDYEVPDDIETDIVLGDIFEIGQHRLLCGDSTRAEDVEKLLQGKEPYLIVTDPPYGVVYDANWRNEADRANGRPIGAMATMKVNNDDNAYWSETWSLSPSKVAYVWHAGRHAKTVQESLEACEFIIRSQVIWVKNNIVISRGDYHWKHEPCWYAVKKGNKGNWAGDRKQTTVWDIDKPLKSETGHSTQKPVECMARPIKNHDGDVYDPFLGSGTTMVAAHQLNRKCYGMEIDPKYCQVIIERMRKLDPNIEIKKNGI
jgi:DNA modification methylase